MSITASYVKGSDLADLSVTWQDATGTAIDMSTGYTFSTKVGTVGSAAVFTKSTGHTGTTTGLTLQWATSGELNDLDAGVYTIQITATRTSDSRQRRQQGMLQITGEIT